jgi:hypothetical protein
MIVKAYNNGTHNRNGAGYGFKVSNADRDEFFKPEWTSILVELPEGDEPVEVKIDPASFWSENSRELVSQAIGKWLRRNGLAPWHVGNAPVFVLEPIADNRFRVEKAGKSSSKI